MTEQRWSMQKHGLRLPVLVSEVKAAATGPAVAPKSEKGGSGAHGSKFGPILTVTPIGP